MNNKHLIAYIVEIALGIGFVIAGIYGAVDSFWSGAGGGLLGVGIVQLVRQIRYRTNSEYKESYDTEAKDERNAFLRARAWGWTGNLFVIIEGLAAFWFKLAGREDITMVCCMSVCLVVLLYWVSYMILSRKY